jgi:hypothetical protein
LQPNQLIFSRLFPEAAAMALEFAQPFDGAQTGTWGHEL